MRAVLFFSIALLSAGPCYAQDEVSGKDRAGQAIKDIQQAYGNKANRADLRQYPIGIFDSGTGGLTVLEQILTFDEFDNQNLSSRTADGKPDFSRESFIFLADQANMPYGNYPGIQRQRFLEQLIVNDARFLMCNQYFQTPTAKTPRKNKSPIKVIVIACNTATAYGQDDIEKLIEKAGLKIKVVGVIDAGARGALDVLKNGKPAAIGVVPTRGTVLSKAYPRAVEANAKRLGLKQSIQVVQQGAVGLAGAIDRDASFINRNVKTHVPRKVYKGPSLGNSIARINPKILKRYGFEFREHRMLFEGTATAPTVLQLNSVDNYIAFHLTTLLETLRSSENPKPLRAIILGCTHFPFYKEAFRKRLKRLHDYQENGRHIYRPIMSNKIALIDPAYFTARELYVTLSKERIFRNGKPKRPHGTRGEFYITMPCRNCPGVKVNDQGWVTYAYKYDRKAGHTDRDY